MSDVSVCNRYEPIAESDTWSGIYSAIGLAHYTITYYAYKAGELTRVWHSAVFTDYQESKMAACELSRDYPLAMVTLYLTDDGYTNTVARYSQGTRKG